VGSYAAENAEYALHQKRRLDQLAVGEMGQVVEMADVVTFEFEARPVRAELDDAPLDLLERVGKDEIARHLQIGGFPCMLERPDLLGRGEEAEIERAHVHGGD